MHQNLKLYSVLHDPSTHETRVIYTVRAHPRFFLVIRLGGPQGEGWTTELFKGSYARWFTALRTTQELWSDSQSVTAEPTGVIREYVLTADSILSSAAAIFNTALRGLGSATRFSRR